MASMSQLTMAMVTLYSGDPKRIQHFMNVYAFAKMIAEEEQLGAKQREIWCMISGSMPQKRNIVLQPESTRKSKDRRSQEPC